MPPSPQHDITAVLYQLIGRFDELDRKNDERHQTLLLAVRDQNQVSTSHTAAITNLQHRVQSIEEVADGRSERQEWWRHNRLFLAFGTLGGMSSLISAANFLIANHLLHR